jgi:hypothetical protein
VVVPPPASGTFIKDMREAKEKLAFTLLLFVIAGVWFLSGFIYGRKTAKKPVDLRVVWDTTEVIKYDTIVREKPVYVAKSVIRHDTVRFTTLRKDTVLVDVPIESKVYAEDSLYYARISGFRCSLDTLKIYPTITTITIREKIKTPTPRFSFGVTAGPSILATPKGQVHAGLGATVGLQYRF